MAQRISRSDRLFEWETGVDVQLAIKTFQKCVADTQVTEFGGSNPDIGGIGVSKILPLRMVLTRY
jgi:hypothetical protein